MGGRGKWSRCGEEGETCGEVGVTDISVEVSDG